MVAVAHHVHCKGQKPMPVSVTLAPAVVRVVASDVQVEREVRPGLAIVRVSGVRWFLKQVYGSASAGAFSREAHVLSALPCHPHLVSLHGIVVLPSGAVDGLLLELIDGLPLSDCRSATPLEKRRWQQQVRDGVAAIHKVGQVWGDAKTANVMIDEHRDAKLIDFGGGHTPRWVPREQFETVAGDLHGLEKTVEFIEGL